MKNAVECLLLQPWHEIVGTCIKVTIEETGTAIFLQAHKKKYRLFIPLTKLKPDELAKQLIAVLKTDNVERPFMIRRITNENNSNDLAKAVHINSGKHP